MAIRESQIADSDNATTYLNAHTRTEEISSLSNSIILAKGNAFEKMALLFACLSLVRAGYSVMVEAGIEGRIADIRAEKVKSRGNIEFFYVEVKWLVTTVRLRDTIERHSKLQSALDAPIFLLVSVGRDRQVYYADDRLKTKLRFSKREYEVLGFSTFNL